MRKIILTSFLIIFLAFPAQVFASVVINEMMPDPVSGSDWIELYNTETVEVDLSSWKIEDSKNVAKTFAEGTKMASSSAYLQVTLGNRLDNGGDTIKLKDNNGNRIDEKSYSSNPGEGITLGRSPDGSSNWGILTSSTPNNANSSFVPSSTPTPSTTPSSTPTPRPTDSPTVTPTSKPASPTLKPTATPIRVSPTISPKLTPTPTEKDEFNQGSVLGENASTPSSNSRKNNSLFLPLMLFLIGGGLIFIAVAVYLFYKQRDLRKNLLKTPNP